MQAHRWRQSFIDLSEDVFRELGFPPPAMNFEDSLPLSMELYLQGYQFELLHSENELREYVLVSCTLGEIPKEFRCHGYRELLKENLSQVRSAGVFFGMDSERYMLRLMFLESLSATSAPALLETMRNIVEKWQSWEGQFFSGNAFTSASDGTDAPLLLA